MSDSTPTSQAGTAETDDVQGHVNPITTADPADDVAGHVRRPSVTPETDDEDDVQGHRKL